MASNPYVNRVDYVAGGVTHTLIDITSDTVTPSTLLQGYTAHDASGAAIVGAALGGGGVYQDENGYLVLAEDESDAPQGNISITVNGTYDVTAYAGATVSVPVGLEYETGTWTPSADVNQYDIGLSNTHSVPPCFYVIWSTSDEYDATLNTAYSVSYVNYGRLGSFMPRKEDDSTPLCALALFLSRTTSTTALTVSSYQVTHPDTDTSGSNMLYSRHWATESKITARIDNSTYWRTGHTYKWMAVWAPTGVNS